MQRERLISEAIVAFLHFIVRSSLLSLESKQQSSLLNYNRKATWVLKHSSGTIYIAFWDLGRIIKIQECPGNSRTVGAYAMLMAHVFADITFSTTVTTAKSGS